MNRHLGISFRLRLPIIEDEANHAEMILEEEEIDTLEESLISFWLSGLN